MGEGVEYIGSIKFAEVRVVSPTIADQPLLSCMVNKQYPLSIQHNTNTNVLRSSSRYRKTSIHYTIEYYRLHTNNKMYISEGMNHRPQQYYIIFIYHSN